MPDEAAAAAGAVAASIARPTGAHRCRRAQNRRIAAAAVKSSAYEPVATVLIVVFGVSLTYRTNLQGFAGPYRYCGADQQNLSLRTLRTDGNYYERTQGRTAYHDLISDGTNLYTLQRSLLSVQVVHTQTSSGTDP
jgi:hypothetical protein